MNERRVFMKIEKGDIIQSKKWPEAVQIDSVTTVGDYVKITGFQITSRIHVESLLSKEEMDDIVVLGGNDNFTESAVKIFLSMEAKRYRLASLYDPLLAMSTSKVDPLPHQIEAVYGYVLKNPRIRFLIADDPGAGKTIMAGLIIKELKLRGLIKRILIIAPGHLRDQWIREMKDRFKETFMPMNRTVIKDAYGENPWEQNNQIIASMDFAKQDDILQSLSSAEFDLVIVDEAHKMSAYAYNKRGENGKSSSKVNKSKRYKLGEALSKNSEHLLFLTATPHRGDVENFRLFLDLLQPGFFANKDMLERAMRNRDNPLFIRRLKEELRDFEGKPLFLPRHVRTLTFNLGRESPKEKELYNELSKYVKEQYNLAMQNEKRRNFAFTQVILQRRLASSTYALLKSLERRRDRLQDILDGKIPTTSDLPQYSEEEIGDMTDRQREEYEKMVETAVVVTDRNMLEKEVETIDSLIRKAKEIISGEEEVKLKQLRSALSELESKYPDIEDKKILIFTESKDTLTYLVDKIREWGYSVNFIHGGMSLQERVEAEQRFKQETQIMVATEAAGEGINLQFCHLMINYDLPWNPNRLEQRMGRIHRYGQKKEVYIVNMVAEDTREGRVLNRLFEKLELIRSALGEKAFDVVGELLNRSLASILTDAAAHAKDMDELLKEVDIRTDPEYIRKVKEDLADSLATHIIDYTRIEEMRMKAEENRLIPEYTENFFITAFSLLDGRIKKRADGLYAIEKIPYELKSISREDDFRRSYGTLPKSYKKATFDKTIAFKNPDAEFISLGHPLFEALMLWIERNYSEKALTGANFIDPDGNMDGYLMFYEGEITDGTGEVAGKRLFCTYIDDKTVEPVSPDILWDLERGEPMRENVDITALKERTETEIIDVMREYQRELQAERKKQAAIKEKYGVRSLDILIGDLDDRALELEARREQGEDVELVIRNLVDKKRRYETARDELKDRIERERNLTMSMPSFIGIVRVLPGAKKRGTEPSPEDKKRIELVGMEMAMNYEREHGRIPEDVSSKTELGFDIRSMNPDGSLARYIEVKARAGRGPVEMTKNEWIKAKRFKDRYYLYVIWNASTPEPEFHMVRNPAENVNALEETEVVRYRVDAEDILKNEEVN